MSQNDDEHHHENPEEQDVPEQTGIPGASPRIGAFSDNSGPGWGVTHTPNGDIHNYNPGQFGNGSGSSSSSGSGHGSSSGSGSGSKPKAPVIAYGQPMVLSVAALTRTEGITVGGAVLTSNLFKAGAAEIAGAGLRVLSQVPYVAAAVGLFVLSTKEIAKDDPKYASKLTFAIPAKDIYPDIDNHKLPLAPATVKAPYRVVSDVKHDKQAVSLAGGVLTDVPVVQAKPTNKKGVYQADIPGFGPLRLTPVPDKYDAYQATPLPRGVEKLSDNTVTGAAPTFDAFTHDAFVVFPSSSSSSHRSVYVSIIDILPPDSLQKKKEEEAQRVKEWQATHPYAMAFREWQQAQEELAQAQRVEKEALTRNRNAIAAWNKQAGVDIVHHRAAYLNLKAQMEKWERIKESALNSGNAFTPGAREFTAFRASTGEQAKIRPAFTTERLIVEQYDAAKHELEESSRVLAEAMEARKQKEQKEKKAKEKTEAAKARDGKGIATGNGQPVGDDWIEDVSKELGAPIPEEIADILRGETFKNFDAARRRLWRELAKHPKFSKLFEEKDLEEMHKGNAAWAKPEDSVGKRGKLEVHHKEQIQHGGKVLDVDNWTILTPKNHIKIHSKRNRQPR